MNVFEITNTNTNCNKFGGIAMTSGVESAGNGLAFSVFKASYR